LEVSLSKKREGTNNSKPDNFARVLAVLGLLVATAAIIVPVLQSKADSQERLGVWMRTNSGGTVLLPGDKEQSSVVQIPWLFTLSNTGNVKLSIIGYDVFQIENGGLSKFPHLVGLVMTPDGDQVVPPITLDAGESITIMMHIGFTADAKVLEKLFKIHEQSGAFTLNEAFKKLAKDGITIYGGSATYFSHDGGVTISLDPRFYLDEPVYRVEFKTGRGRSFYVQGSDTMSKFSS